MKILDKGNWGLRLLALVLAIIVYHALKNESSHPSTDNDRSLFEHN